MQLLFSQRKTKHAEETAVIELANGRRTGEVVGHKLSRSPSDVRSDCVIRALIFFQVVFLRREH